MKETIIKIWKVLLGSAIMGLGISFTIWANVGSDPMTVFWMGTAKQLSISIGMANLLVCGIILIFVFFLDRKQIHVGSLLNPLVIAVVTDTMSRIQLSLDSYVLRSLLCIIGLIILAFGIALYALADYGKGAYEALVFCVCDKLSISVGVVRTTCDISFAILGLVLGGVASTGTILAIIFMGTGIQFFIKQLQRRQMS